MTSAILSLLGGVGLFMFGMHTMTGALRDLAGRRLRRVLARAATTPWRGAVAGAVVTALVQSSTAVTVTLIGFVGAGILTFAQSVGIILGANIGTTITGWIVALAGLKLKLALLASPLLFLGALVGSLTEGRVARASAAVAGFALVFLGLAAMQAAVAGLGSVLSPEMLPPDSWTGRALLVLIGAALVAAMQSSSAGVAMALVFYSAGAIGLMQATALVIGADIGTTVTGLIAALGGSRAMLRTATAHVLYNVLTGAAAFLLGGLYGQLAALIFAPRDPAAVVAFHTGFNVVGVVVMLPFARPFARLVERLVPDRTDILPEPLDRGLLDEPAAALDAATGATDRIAAALCVALAGVLRADSDATAGSQVPLDPLLPRLPVVFDDLGTFLARVSLAANDRQGIARYTALFHRLDHLRRLAARAGQDERIALLRADPTLRRPTCLLALALAAAAERPDADRMLRIARKIHARSQQMRQAALLREHAGPVLHPDVFAITDAIRWLERVAGHAERITRYGDAAAGRDGRATGRT